MASKKNITNVKGNHNTIYQDVNLIFGKDFDLSLIEDYKSKRIIETQSDFDLSNDVLLYYPYFELEQKGLIPKIDHELYLKVLSLLADKILLPPSHLLDTNLYNVNLLKSKFHQFIQDEIFITSYRKGQSSIADFVEEKISEKANTTSNQQEVAKGVVELFSHYKHFIKRDIKKQSGLFYNFLQQGIFEDNETSFANDPIFSVDNIRLLEKEINKVIDTKGFQISKTDLDVLVLKLGQNRELNPLQVKRVLDFSNNAYFYAGGLGNASIVAYSDYFLSVPIPAFLNDKDNGTNLFYSPLFFIELLKALGVINRNSDLKNLDYSDISTLRKSSIFKSFLKNYKKFSLICYEHFNNSMLDNKAIEVAVLKRFSKETKLLHNFRSGLFEGVKNVIGMTALPHPLNLMMLFPLFSVLGDYERKISKTLFLEDIILRLATKSQPLGVYCLTIENMIGKSRYE